MKIIVLPLAAVSALLLAAGCSNNTSTATQSTNATAEQPPAMNTTLPAGAEMSNAVPSAGMNTNSTGMETNTPAATNNINTTTNMTPP